MSRRVWIIVVGVIAALAGGAVGLWFWLGREAGPMLEVVVPTAPIKLGQKVIAQASKGDRFAILGSRGQWYQVKVRVEGKEQLGWIHALQVWRIEPKPKAAGPVEAQILTVNFPDAVTGELPPWGKRWVLFEVQVRAVEADADGTCPIHTDRFVFHLQHLRYTKPRRWKTVELGGREIEQLLKHEVLRLAVGEMKLLCLVILVDSRLVVRQGWTVEYVPPEPDAAIRLGRPKPSTAASPKPATATQPTTAAPPKPTTAAPK